VLAWGSGTSRRNNSDRIAAFAKRDDRRENIELLRKAAQHARDASAREAYRCLIRQGRGQIDRLGPAFFAKFLYFVGQGAIGYPCLIIDARVAESLYEAGWKLPRGLIDGRGDYSFNWHTDTYVSYCALLKRWADEQSERRYQVIATDQIERSLFKGP
jgi:hypothetical protein